MKVSSAWAWWKQHQNQLDLYTIEIETNVFKMTFQKCVKTPSLQQHVSKSQGGQSTEQSELCGGK